MSYMTCMVIFFKNHIMKHLILFGLLFISGYLYAQDEIYIGESDKETYYYIKGSAQSIEFHSSRYKAWIKAVSKKPKVINKKTYTGIYELQLCLIDCQYNQIGILRVVTYNKNGTTVLNSKTYDDENTSTLDDVVPGSIGAMIVDETCNIINSNL